MSLLLAGTAVLGAIQTGLSIYNLVKMGKEKKPAYEVTPELTDSYNQAKANAKFGYTPAQQAAFMNNVATSQNAAYRRAVDTSGGQMSTAISRVLQGNKLGAYGQFAASDAQLKLQNQRYADQIGGQVTAQKNLITQNEIQDRIRREQAFGQAMSSGMTNMASAANFQGMSGGGYGGGMGYGPFDNPYNATTKTAIRIR